MTVRLRPHHLLCLLTYVGRGYTPAFTENYDAVAARLGHGEDILIVSGPDDVCAPLLGEAEAHCLRPGILGRDGLAARDLGDLLTRPIEPGKTLRLDLALMARMRAAFSAGHTRSACGGCEWSGLCSAVSAGGFRETRLHPPA